jgi:hypothetical protein
LTGSTQVGAGRMDAGHAGAGCWEGLLWAVKMAGPAALPRGAQVHALLYNSPIPPPCLPRSSACPPTAAAYSPRPGTPAAIWDNQVADLIKSDRLQRLNAVVNRVAEERAQRFLGRELEVLVEGPNPRDPDQVGGRVGGCGVVGGWVWCRGWVGGRAGGWVGGQ